jgi:hypothetical protein
MPRLNATAPPITSPTFFSLLVAQDGIQVRFLNSNVEGNGSGLHASLPGHALLLDSLAHHSSCHLSQLRRRGYTASLPNPLLWSVVISRSASFTLLTDPFFILVTRSHSRSSSFAVIFFLLSILLCPFLLRAYSSEPPSTVKSFSLSSSVPPEPAVSRSPSSSSPSPTELRQESPTTRSSKSSSTLRKSSLGLGMERTHSASPLLRFVAFLHS